MIGQAVYQYIVDLLPVTSCDDNITNLESITPIENSGGTHFTVRCLSGQVGSYECVDGSWRPAIPVCHTITTTTMPTSITVETAIPTGGATGSLYPNNVYSSTTTSNQPTDNKGSRNKLSLWQTGTVQEVRTCVHIMTMGT